ncbi:hypothetical protein L218DRAFT_1007855 [Marasmius fiardii PR-910]|nr:hypothetical protein L218DRAFT_1007855 [Marasmius fiardii PR-910]
MADTDRTVRMEFLTGATGVKINQAHFSNIGRDQHNYYAVQNPMFYNRRKRRKVEADLIELSEFTEVKRGDIYKDKDVGNSWRLRSNEKDATEAAVYLADIAIPSRFRTNKFTVKTYRGRQAMKEWRRDFLRCSKDWRGNVPLYGYSRSSVPLLIFHGELVPLAHIEARLGNMGMFYIDLLRSSLGCAANELWMDPAKGRFCRGPTGPECFENYLDHDDIAIPSDVEFLNDDILIRYFSEKQDDLWFVDALSHAGHCEKLEDSPASNHPQVISSTTNSSIAFNNQNVWWWSGGCIANGELLPDGTIRLASRIKLYESTSDVITNHPIDFISDRIAGV